MVLIKKKNIRKHLADQKGVSLIEAILMIIIMGITIIPLSTLATNNIKYGTKTLLMTNGCLYAQEIMETIIAEYGSQISSVGGFTNVMSKWSGTTTPDPPVGYSGIVQFTSLDSVSSVVYSNVTVTITNTEIPNIIVKARLVR
jgi:Tfp pilus assembly protein PilV